MATCQTSTTPSSRPVRLARYCSLGVGLLAGAGAATTADAAITFINLGNQVLFDTDPVGNNPVLSSFDLNGDGQLDIEFAHLTIGLNGAAFVASAEGGQLGTVGQTFDSFFYPARFNAGANIGPTQTFTTLSNVFGSLAAAGGYPNSQWATDPSPGFLAIQFQNNGSTVYGWVQIAVGPNTGPMPRALTLLNAAFETSGGPITAGAVPEPATSVGILALGAAGLAWHRRARARR